MAEADSWATDAHKWLNTTYDCGIALVRDAAAMRAAMEAAAAYLPGDAAREPMHHTPQSSQRARGAEVWAVLAALGHEGVAELIDRTCRLARRFADGVRHAGYEVLNDVVLNQVLVRAATDDQTLALVESVQQDGTCWCGPTIWEHRPAMRISVSGWATSSDDIKKSADAIITAASTRRA
jgi:glutamate/tyrosine decarboxylase-like PLP-dependent enzyme